MPVGGPILGGKCGTEVAGGTTPDGKVVEGPIAGGIKVVAGIGGGSGGGGGPTEVGGKTGPA